MEQTDKINGRRTVVVDDTCKICSKEIDSDAIVAVLPCNNNHVFHSSCIEKWFDRKNSCPTCKK
jgi:hypothetical protein